MVRVIEPIEYSLVTWISLANSNSLITNNIRINRGAADDLSYEILLLFKWYNLLRFYPTCDLGIKIWSSFEVLYLVFSA